MPAVALSVLLALLLAACGPGADTSSRPAAAAEPAQVPASPPEPVASALDDPHHPGLPPPLVEPTDLTPGGPPPDGIPPIDRPRFERASRLRWLADREPVLSFTQGGETRAYPVQVLLWHEIVNDTVGGVPVAVTYCPLCNSAVAYDRRSGSRVLSFGTSGLVYRSALVMYDRQTESLWSHFTGEAIVGVLTGTQLRTYPVALVSWGTWRRAHPDGMVLSRETGADRPYGRNPYPGYDDVNSPPFLFEGRADGRLRGKERVVGVRDGREAVAVVRSELVRRGVLTFAVGDRQVVALASGGTTSALDDERVVDGKAVGSVGVFELPPGGMDLQRAGSSFRDRATGAVFDVLGRHLSGSPGPGDLVPVEHVDTFWFAWVAFEPGTRVVPAPEREAGEDLVCYRSQWGPTCEEPR